MNAAELEALIADEVQAALEQTDHSMRMTELRDAAAVAFAVAYEEQGGDPEAYDSAQAAFLNTLNSAAAHTFPDGTDAQADRITHIFATAAFNGATVAAAPGEQFEWITMLDDKVRGTHVPLHGEVRAAGTPFIVDGHPLLYPGQPVGPPEVWINCRCTLRASLTAATEAPAPEKHTGIAMVAKPKDPEALTVEGGLPADELHVTLGFFGKTDDPDLNPTLRGRLESFLQSAPMSPHTAKVSGVAYIGDDDPQACVLLVESGDLADARKALEEFATPDSLHPHFTPHMTLGYGIPMPESHPTDIELDDTELWWGDERMSATAALIAASDKPWSQFSASDYTIGQWRRACLLKMPGGDPEAKSTYKLPVREPGGALNRNGVHAAASALAGGRGGINAPAPALAAARSKLRGLYRQLGEDPPDSLKADAETTCACEEEDPELDGLMELLAWAPSTSAPGTRDGPGWLTNPEDAQRLRNYWTKGAGAAKIRWGSPGDLTRCHKHLEKYVGPFAWGTCQNLHHVVFGKWNPESRGRHGGGDPDEMIDLIDAAFAAAAALEDTVPTLTTDLTAASTLPGPPLEWFQNPGFDAATPLTITSDGRVLGHLASWDTCHVGFSGECVKPPHSNTGYAYFRTGEIETREGELVATGKITMDTGHADKDAGPQPAVSHYDNTGTAVADVAAGEDEFGIWIAGALRPNIGEQKMYDLRATGALSGDWRRIGGNLELVAALAVNVPGFPVPRIELAASGSHLYALTAAAVVTHDPNAGDPERIAIAVIARLDQREADAKRRERATALSAQINTLRAEALTAGLR